MSTLALLGLLVVLLVAIGIAGFLLRGRRGASADPDAPPRTVAELVDRRRDDDRDTGATTSISDVEGDDTDTRPVGATDPVAGTADADTPVIGVRSPAGAGDGSGDGGPDAGGPGVGGPDVGGSDAGGSDAGGPGDGGADPDRPGTTDGAGPDGTDAKTGPVATRRPGTGDLARDRAGVGASISTADGTTDSSGDAAGSRSETGATAPTADATETGPPEAADDLATTDAPRDRAGDSTDAVSSDPSTAAPDDLPSTPRPGSDADTGPSSPPWSRGFVAGRQITPPASATGRTSEQQPSAEGERPSPPPRQDSRSPVDPDLVKRVTSVPSTGSRRTSDPDTEREFREARDRMAGPAAPRPSRVPEQSSRSPESAPTTEPAPTARPRPTPVARRESADAPDDTDRPGSGGAAAVVAGGAVVGAVTAAVVTSRSTSAGDADDTEDPDAEAPDTRDAGGPENTGPESATSTGSDSARPSPFPRAADSVADTASAPGDEPPPRPSPRVMRSPGPVAAEPTAAEPNTEQSATAPSATEPSATEPSATEPSAAAPSAAEPGGDESSGDESSGDQPPSGYRPGGSVPNDAVIGAAAGVVGPGGSDADATRVPGSADPEPNPGRPEQVVAFSGASPVRVPPASSTPAQDVDVHVADRGERPLAGVALSVVDGAGAPAGSGTTGADGDARLRAPGAGRYLLVAASDGYQTGVVPYAVADDPVRVPVTLTRSSTLRGTVRTSAGAPRSGVSVALVQDGDALARVDADTDGAFRFADLAAGHYLLSAGTEPGSTVHVPAETDVEHDVRVSETETV